MVRTSSRFSLFVVFAALFATPAAAQAQTGRIAGIVQDEQGGALPAATVTATNRATRMSRSATTGPDGRYAISDLPAGAYTVAVALFGYREVTRGNVQVRANATATLNLTLEPLTLEALIVTAMLREQELVDVPFSIAAPTAAVLRSRGAEDIEGIAANIAGFSVQNLGPGQSTVAMRGASGGQIARDQPGVKEQVGAYLDDSPISLSLFTPDIDLFDVSRVEVLRGPQGTLFGAGSLSGTVRYISNQPVLGLTSLFGELGGNFIDGGGPGGNVKLGINAPLGGSAAARVVGYYTTYGGYMDSQQPILEADNTLTGFRLEEDVNSGQRMGARAAIRFEPVSGFSITPRVLFQRLEMDGWNRIDDFNILANPYTTTDPPITLGEREMHTQIEEPFTDDFLLGDLNLQYDFGAVNLTSVTSFTSRDILVVRDAGALTASITGGSIGLPESVYRIDSPLDDATESTVFTQELRLGGDFGFGVGVPTGEDVTQWVVGAFYSDNKRDYRQSLLVAGFEDATGIPTQGLRAPRDVLFFSDLSYDLSQVAVFGEATVPVGSRLDLTGGLRWYSFNEDREQVFDGIFAHDNTGTEVVSQPGSIEADGFAPRFIASLEATDWLNLNAQAAKGFRLGGINDPLNVPLCTQADSILFSGQDTWDDETVWNYEVGAKSRILGGRGTLNVSAFYMDISDYQVVITAGSCSSRLVLNAPEARSQGIEVELSAAPTNFFDFSVSGTFTDAELRSRPVSVSGAEIVIPGIEAGNRLPSVPEFEAAAAATFRFGVAQMPAFLTGSLQHVGSRYTQINDHAEGVGTVDMTALGNEIGGPLTQTTFTFDPEMPAYTLFNLRTGLSLGDDWEVALFANNLTDERAFLALDRERGTLARVGYLTNQPRTFGISFRFGD